MAYSFSKLPDPFERPTSPAPQPKSTIRSRLLFAALLCPLLLLSAIPLHSIWSFWPNSARIPTTRRTAENPYLQKQWKESLDRCSKLHVLPGVPADFHKREESDRFVPSTPPTLIRNATIWTGEDNGNELLLAHDVLLDRGLLIALGRNLSAPTGAEIVEAYGAWLTPGIFDMHSHIGVDSLPELSGANDVNSVANPILPHLRSLDGINTHDLAFKRTVSGGVTTSLVLPGSANNIGGQAFAIKLRPTKEKTPESLVLEMPYNVPTPGIERKEGDPPRWRHMKMACGENIRRVYKQTRLDLAYNFRSALTSAAALRDSQDAFCAKAELAQNKGEIVEERFPDDLQWEALVDVLRGKVKVNTHCYEATDLAAFVRYTNEFKFPVAAFHHAHEAYLVPDLLQQAWNSTPAVALFATQARYKRESWRGSDYAPQKLAEQNITVIMKSDHPVLDSRFLLFEAQQAHHFGLPTNLALRSIITSSAEVAGFSHRLGYLRPNYDADVVLWDSHPLKLGATPRQVFIDGIKQIERPFEAKPLETDVEAPEVASKPKYPICEEELDDGSEEREREVVDSVLFEGVREVLLEGDWDVRGETEGEFEVLVREGRIACVGECAALVGEKTRKVGLKGGSLLPPLTAYGPALGLTEMISEKSTTDNPVYDPLYSGGLSTTQQLWGQVVAVKAVDGLAFGGKHLRISHDQGFLKGVVAPMGNGFFRGVSVAFKTGARNVLQAEVLVKEAVALHVTIGHYKGTQTPSISTEIAELRRLLLGGLEKDTSTMVKADYFALAAHGTIPLVINAWKADVIGTLIRLKGEIEREPNATAPLRWVIHGGQEAHLVAHELAAAEISVVLSPPRAFPESWDERRAVAGPPLSPRNAPNILHNAGVRFGLGVPEEWQARTLLWEAAWAWRDSNGEVDRKSAIAWVSTNLDEMLDLPKNGAAEFVAYERDPFEFGSRAVAVSTVDSTRVEIIA